MAQTNELLQGMEDLTARRTATYPTRRAEIIAAQNKGCMIRALPYQSRSTCFFTDWNPAAQQTSYAARGLMTAAVTKLTAVFYALLGASRICGRKELYGIF